MNSSPDLPRFDPLLLVHKAVRQVMFEVAAHVGAVDASDIFAVERCAKQVGRLVELFPESAATLATLCDALFQRDSAPRHAAAAALYGEVVALVATQLARQQHHEATTGADLLAQRSEEQLRAARREQLAALSERELQEAIGPLGAALTPQELAALLDDLQASVDPQSFAAVADTLRRRLDPARWSRVVRERGGAAPAPAVGVRRPAPRRPGSAGAAASNHRRSQRADRQRLLAQ